MFKCSKQPNTEAFVLNIEKFDIRYCFEFRPARPCLFGRVLQPPQAVRQEQIGAIIQTGQWQAGIRIFA
jgi:hypothetical protein